MENQTYSKQFINKKIRFLKAILQHEKKKLDKYYKKLENNKKETPKQENIFSLCLLTIEEKSEYYNKLNNDLIILENTLKLISK